MKRKNKPDIADLNPVHYFSGFHNPFPAIVMMIRLLFAASLCLIAPFGSSLARSTEHIALPYQGVSFEIPEGFFGQASGNAYVLGSEDGTVLVLITGHAKTNTGQLDAELRKGYADDDGTELRLEGNLEPYGDSGTGGTFSGYLVGTPAHAYILGLINPEGRGITISCLVRGQESGNMHKTLATSLAASFRFFPPAADPESDEWTSALGGCRLFSSEGYQSSSSGGYSTQTQIELCRDGHFRLNSSTLVSADVGAVSGSSSSEEKSEGDWQIGRNFEDLRVLRLISTDGLEEEYVIEGPVESLALNGRSFMKTCDAAAISCK